MRDSIFHRSTNLLLLLSATAFHHSPLAAATVPARAFFEQHCTDCHDAETKRGGLDLTALSFQPENAGNFASWVKVFDRVSAGEMPPKQKARPTAADLEKFLSTMQPVLLEAEQKRTAAQGRAKQRRLNGYEYENALRDLLSAPWLQVKGQFPDDGEASRFNKLGDALDVSHVHMARYISAADYAMREVLSVQWSQPPTSTKRYYARDQRTLTTKTLQTDLSKPPGDRSTFLVLGTKAQPPGAKLKSLTVGDADPVLREEEAVGWIASNYVTGFRYRWDGFRAPVAGRYRIRFSGSTVWVEPGKNSKTAEQKTDEKREPITVGRTQEPITVYTRNALMNRRVGGFDLTPEPAVHDLGETWLLANETLVPDPSRFFRSRPPGWKNPLMTPEGGPGVAFRWMEVEGPLYDQTTTAGYKLLFGDLPLTQVEGSAPGVLINLVDSKTSRPKGGEPAEPLSEVSVDVVSQDPGKDADRLMRTFLARAYRRPVAENDVQRFLQLVAQRRAAGLSFAESMFAGYTAVLASPGFIFLDEKPGKLDDPALATRLALFLWNSTPDKTLRTHAERGELHQPAVLRAETERLLADAKSHRFQEAFLDYWLDLRKMEASTPSTTLYNDYYLDDALAEAALAETQLYFHEMIQRDLPARCVVDSDFTFLNERLALHYGIPGVQGIAMRRVALPPDSPRGGLMTQASVLKVTANGTTTSPVLRGKWILERILGFEIPPPPPVAAVEPDIRGAVTIRQQLEKHRDNESCAACHRKMDPPGFALESFDVMGAWRDRYRGVADNKPAVKGIGKNGHAFEFHYGLPVDSAGELPDGRPFKDIRDFKRLVRADEVSLARNLARQLTVYATGAPVRFGDRAEIENILQRASVSHYGLRTLIHELIQSPLFLNK